MNLTIKQIKDMVLLTHGQKVKIVKSNDRTHEYPDLTEIIEFGDVPQEMLNLEVDFISTSTVGCDTGYINIWVIQMYIEYEIHNITDIAYLVENEAFNHLTRDEAAELILDIISRFFKYYDGGMNE